MKNTLTLTTPHAAAMFAGMTSPCAGITRLTADCGAVLVMTDHDLYCVEHEFDLVASGGMTVADLREVHAWICANVIIPSRNA